MFFIFGFPKFSIFFYKYFFLLLFLLLLLFFLLLLLLLVFLHNVAQLWSDLFVLFSSFRTLFFLFCFSIRCSSTLWLLLLEMLQQKVEGVLQQLQKDNKHLKSKKQKKKKQKIANSCLSLSISRADITWLQSKCKKEYVSIACLQHYFFFFFFFLFIFRFACDCKFQLLIVKSFFIKWFARRRYFRGWC